MDALLVSRKLSTGFFLYFDALPTETDLTGACGDTGLLLDAHHCLDFKHHATSVGILSKYNRTFLYLKLRKLERFYAFNEQHDSSNRERGNIPAKESWQFVNFFDLFTLRQPKQVVLKRRCFERERMGRRGWWVSYHYQDQHDRVPGGHFIPITRGLLRNSFNTTTKSQNKITEGKKGTDDAFGWSQRLKFKFTPA